MFYIYGDAILENCEQDSLLLDSFLYSVISVNNPISFERNHRIIKHIAFNCSNVYRCHNSSVWSIVFSHSLGRYLWVSQNKFTRKVTCSFFTFCNSDELAYVVMKYHLNLYQFFLQLQQTLNKYWDTFLNNLQEPGIYGIMLKNDSDWLLNILLSKKTYLSNVVNIFKNFNIRILL